MNIYSKPICDKKIKAFNVITEMTLNEYYDLIKEVMLHNEFQRNKVRSSKTIYSLLKQDLLEGCLMPPIVLALNCPVSHDIYDDNEKLIQFINDNKDQLFILDGLQRTFTIQDIIKDSDATAKLENILRVEIYLNISREGILYRMLTLNTGQTPMSLRHQVEIIYSSLRKSTDDVKLIPDTEKNNNKIIGYYKFSDAIDAFTSFMEGDYLQITREKLLTTIKSYEKFSTFYNSSKDMFEDLMRIYTEFQKRVDNAIHGISIKDQINFDNPFGTDTYSIFSKSQPMTGFGAAIARLMDLDIIKYVCDIESSFPKMDNDDIFNGIIDMLERLDIIKTISKKIGNGQRCFFYYFFRNLWDKEGSCYLRFEASIDKAFQQFKRDM